MSRGRRDKRKKNRNKKVETSRDIEQLVLGIFRDHPKKLYSDKAIIKLLLGKDSKENIQKAISSLMMKDRISVVPPGKLRYNSPTKGAKEFVGVVDMTKSGAGYLVCDEIEDDIYIPSRHMNRSFHGDKVKVSINTASRKNRLEGMVTEIVERKKEQFIGTVSKDNGFTFVIPDGKVSTDFYIAEGDDLNAKDKDKVVVKIKDWPKKRKNPYGLITEVLGQAGGSDIEMRSILIEHGFRLNFPEAVMEEVNDLPTKIPKSEYSNRRDFREIPTFTIDPVDAKDFDDALSLRRLDNGNWEVGVHIADVSYYVVPGSELDKEAIKRATSVYLVDRVLPMFPEQLSNVICSLRPEEEKLCYAAVFEMDNDAKIINEWFGRTIIYSDKRFAYDDAMRLIDGEDGPLKDEVIILNKLAHKLRKRRFKKGSINFDSVEVKFKLDQDAKPIGVYVKERHDAHLLIEDFMLLANKQVAHWVGVEKSKGATVPLVYRIHDSPDLDRLTDFRLFAARFGYKLDFNSPKQITKSLNKFLNEVKGKPEQNLLEGLAIRSMSKAVYTTDNIGHYGLGFEYYAHFTSPIRRYPDVLVHRTVDAVVKNMKVPTKNKLEKLAKHSSERERAAMTAERESTKYKMAEYMENRIGEEFDGVISGVKNWGIYVEIKEFNCEGMVKADDLDDDVYSYDEREMAFKGARSGKKYTLGDELRVRVDAVNLSKRTIDLVIAEEE